MTQAQTTRSQTRVQGFADEEMDFQLIRQLGATAYGGAAIGECLALAAATHDADPADWVRNFTALGERTAADAAQRLVRGHGISAADQYLRAANSYRAAEYYTDVTDPQHQQLGQLSRDCFLQAMQAQGRACDVLKIPYGDGTLPGYFLPAGPRQGKTVIVVSGFDGTLEESYLQNGLAALQRGYHLLLMAGPGQMDTWRFSDKLTFEPDYEKPLGLFLNALSDRPEIDWERLGLVGISFGGYFATRAAGRDQRIRALTANSPIVNLHDYMTGFVGFDPARMPDDQDFTIDDLPQIPEALMNRQRKASAAALIRRFGCRSFKQTFMRMNEFTVQERLTDICCPCLGLVGAGEGNEPRRQYDVFLAETGGPATGKVFTAEEGADTHCQVGNLVYANAVIFDWMDKIFG